MRSVDLHLRIIMYSWWFEGMLTLMSWRKPGFLKWHHDMGDAPPYYALFGGPFLIQWGRQ